MSHNLRNGLNAGIVFGIITIFLVLIGFTVTASDLIGTFLGNASASAVLGLPPVTFNLLIFLFLLGVWAGASGARKSPTEADSWRRVLSSAGLAGLILGILAGGLAMLIGSLFLAGVRMSTYFAQLLPDAIRLYLLGLSPVSAAIFYVIFFFISGLLGGVFGYRVLRGSWRQRFSIWINTKKQLILNWSGIQLFKRTKSIRLIVYALVIVIVFLIPLVIGDYWNYTVGTVGIYVLLGLGLNIVVGLAGLLDLGYVAFFAIGGYTVALLTAPAPHHLMWSFWVAIPIGIVLAAVAGVLLGVPVLRLRGDYLAIVTLGFGQIIAILLRSDALTAFTGGPKGVSAVGGPTLFGHSLGTPEDFVYLILLAVVLVIFVTIRLRSSRVGRAWEAIREDETVARAMGINTWSHKLLAFAIGAAFAGLGGVIFASRNQFTGPEDYNLMVSFNVLASVIVGGMGSIPGVVGGAFTLKGLPEVLRELENYRVLAFGALLVVMMLIRPEGLLPTSRRKMEIKELQDPDGEEAGETSGGKS
jgi:ABC-type branched-subunit amino acid transport system permease subunit